MKLHGTTKRNNQGILEIGQVDVNTLKNIYGTPLYIFDQALLESNLEMFQESFSHEEINGIVAYASKAFLTIGMAQLVMKHGLSIDVASGGELYTVLKAGFPMNRVYFHGNNKTNEELQMAINLKPTLICDHEEEVKTLMNLCEEHKTSLDVYLRVNPGIDVQTHDFIKTSKLDSKFGVNLYQESTLDLIRTISKHPYLNLKGLHAHIGSQIHQVEPFFENIHSLLKVYERLNKEGIKLTSLNIGGGFGVYYTKEDEPIDLKIFLKDLIKEVVNVSHQYQLDLKSVIIEPGRSLVSNAGSTLYTVGSIKKVSEDKSYVFVDGGMSDNPRYALYQAKYEATIANRDEGVLKPYTIAGKLCESGDILSENVMLKEPRRDDLLLMSSTGAYTFSMSSNYNRMLRPAVVFVKDGFYKLHVRRQTLDDLIMGDLDL